MKSRTLFAIFLIIISLYSCTTFKGVKSPESINGTFKAFCNQKQFEGFFSISKSSLRLDIVNTFGLSIYGIYAQNKKVFFKDYQTGKIYKNIKINGQNLSVYKQFILYTMKNFTYMCSKNANKNVKILACEKIDDKILPSSMIFEANNGQRMRINLYNISIKSYRGVQ